MYLSFFGLHSTPFSIVPNPNFLLLTPQHKAALAHLTFSTQTDGIVVLTGEAGTGKTTVIRTFLEQQNDAVNTAVIIHPQLPAVQMLQAICHEFGVRYQQQYSFRQLLDALWQFLLEQHSQNKRNILIIDEAHNLSAAVMEAVRMLTNLETTDKKLLQIVLVGQQELLTLLADDALRQIQQRVIAVFHVQAMDAHLVRQYIQHRMTVAGAHSTHFNDAACALIAKYADGIPRLINRLADRSLLVAYTHKANIVEAKHVHTAYRELPHAKPQQKSRVPLALAGVIGCVLLSAVVISSWLSYHWYHTWQETYAQITQTTPRQVQSQTQGITTDGKQKITPRAKPIATAEQALFALWGEKGVDCTHASLFSMACIETTFEFDHFVSLDTPALIDFQGEQVALIALEAQDAILHTTRGMERAPMATVRAEWQPNLTYIMRVPTGFTEVLSIGSANAYSRFIQRRLAHFYDDQQDLLARAISQQLANRIAHETIIVDSELIRIVSDFQQRQQLNVDGIVGIETYLRLMRLTDPDAIQLRVAA